VPRRAYLLAVKIGRCPNPAAMRWSGESAVCHRPRADLPWRRPQKTQYRSDLTLATINERSAGDSASRPSTATATSVEHDASNRGQQPESARARWWPSGCINLLCVRMLHVGLRVTDLERSLDFYSALGYAEVGGVPETEFGSLTMLQLPDDPFVSLELVHDPTRPVKDVSAVNHLVVQVDDLETTIADLATRGVTAEPPAEPGPGIRTSWLTDPDGYRIELVQWPPGHPAGMTAADFG
jgi:catechol 2,3-dioxygenase-like lactoylglutathione lyase family enzyme